MTGTSSPSPDLASDLSSCIRAIPDYPRAGVIFRDVTTLFLDSVMFGRSIDALCSPYSSMGIDYVAGIEARGFVLGGALARQLGVGFLSVRKSGKLPRETVGLGYSMEYGDAEIEVHRDALKSGDKVLVVDDLIATGGTAEAATKLCQNVGADVVGACFVVDLPDLGGRAKIEALGVPVHTLIAFEGE